MIIDNNKSITISSRNAKDGGSPYWLAFVFLLFLQANSSAFATAKLDPEATKFKQTWALASKGKYSEFRQQMPAQKNYLLYPYLQYEDYRSRMAMVPAAEMAAFIDQHRQWAFASGLRQAWLRQLGRQQRWQDLLTYSGEFSKLRDAETRCLHINARIHTNKSDPELSSDALGMWLTGKSQHKACDPVFKWMDRQQHISVERVWRRALLAVQAGNLNLAKYLKHRLPTADQTRLDAYLKLWRHPSSGFADTRRWADSGRAREFILAALLKQARTNPDKAQRYWRIVSSRFGWSDNARGRILFDLALFSAVELDNDVIDRIDAVPAELIDDQLLQWRLRTALKHERWDQILISYERMSEKSKSEGRFRFWQARAMQQLGQQQDADKTLHKLALEATFWGFMAADQLHQPYRICPLTPPADSGQYQPIADLAAIKRALELRKVELDDFANREWRTAMAGLNKDELRQAAALAAANNWSIQAILALGQTGDMRYYQWRFPLDYQQDVNLNANKHNLDPALVYGLMRAESAMNHRAISGAKAYGLMQLLPATAKSLARKTSLNYQGRNSLLDPSINIAFGTQEMQQLLQKYNGVPAYVLGAYNAGPGAVDRWLKQRPNLDIERWIELMPYYETRDYIPRVMAFSTIYAWRMGVPLTRVSYRLRQSVAAPGGLGLTTASCSP